MKRTKKVIKTTRNDKQDVMFRYITKLWGKTYTQGVHSLSKSEVKELKGTRHRGKDIYLLITK